MIIGIDIDDTISDTYGCIFPYAQKYTTEDLNKNIEIIDKNCFNHMYYSTAHDWNEKEHKEFLDKYYQTILLNIKPKLFAVETINELKKQGHKIILITARFPSDKFDIEELTIQWLKDNKINYDELIVNAQDKVEVARKKQIDIFVDDSIRNCEKVSEVQIETFIMDTIINVNYNNDKIKRIYSWPHFYQEIKKQGGK